MPHLLPVALSLALVAGAAAADPAAVLRTAWAGVPQTPAMQGLGPDFADLGAAATVLAAVDLSAYTDVMAGPLGPLALAAPLGGQPQLTANAGGAWPALVGFGPADVAVVVSYGTPPEQALRLTLTPGAAAAVPAALTANGYSEAATPFGPLFLRGETDFAVSLEARNPDDPFGGMLGQSSRVLLQGDVLTRAAGLPPVEAAMNGPFWGDRGDLAALLDAMSGLPEGSLILRAQILTDPSLFSAAPPAVTAAPGGKTPAASVSSPGMPSWSLGIVADVVTEGVPTVVFGFVYATDLQAREAGQAVATGWDQPMPASGLTPAAAIGPVAVDVTGAGPFVLTVSVPGDWTAEGMLVNLPFQRAYQAILQRSLPVFGPPL